MNLRISLRALAVGVLLFGTSQAFAQAWPARPVRLLVSFAAGGPTDVVARLLADKLGTLWGQSVIVENRPGAGGTIGSALLAKSPPDGYTLNLTASSHAYNDALMSNLPYDPVKDFTTISLVVTYTNVLLVHPSLPPRSLKEFVAYAKQNPGKLSVASSGSGTGAHIAAELFRRTAGIDFVIVHYKGAAPATTDLIGGQVQAMFNNPLSSMPLIKSGKVFALATTAAKRSPTMPDIPTVAESGYPSFNTDTWFGVLGPAGMPRELVAKISKDVAAVIAMPDVKQSLLAQGLEPASSTPEKLAEMLRSDHDTYGKLIREAKIRLE
jgi:tripartite-type tricarboxylate transporter receptor subunit TctC